MKIFFSLVFAALSWSCSPSTYDLPETGLQGQVLRGPITPVCKDNEPCEAPFSAVFVVLKNNREVSRFQSDTRGEFAIALDAGSYIVVPDSSAPLMRAELQRKEVEVQPEGFTQVILRFDTGIR